MCLLLISIYTTSENIYVSHNLKELLKDAQFRIIVSQDSRTHDELYYKPFLYCSVPALGKLHILMTKSRAILLVSLMGTQPCLLICEMFGCSHATVAEVSTCKRD